MLIVDSPSAETKDSHDQSNSCDGLARGRNGDRPRLAHRHRTDPRQMRADGAHRAFPSRKPRAGSQDPRGRQKMTTPVLAGKGARVSSSTQPFDPGSHPHYREKHRV